MWTVEELEALKSEDSWETLKEVIELESRATSIVS